LAPGDGVSSSAGALANLVPRLHSRRDDRGAEILPRLPRSRLIGREATGARGNGRTPWEWGLPQTDVGVPVIRPSRGPGVIHAGLGAHRPTIWVSDLDSAPTPHPAAAWQVCLAHPRRDGPFARAAGDTVFAPRRQRGLRRACAIHTRRDTRAASPLSQSRGDLRRRVDRG
jgi:transposase